MSGSSDPASHPCSDTGRLQSDVSRLVSELSRKAEQHETSTLNSKVADLARSIGEVSSICFGLCTRIERLEEEFRSRLG